MIDRLERFRRDLVKQLERVKKELDEMNVAVERLTALNAPPEQPKPLKKDRKDGQAGPDGKTRRRRPDGG